MLVGQVGDFQKTIRNILLLQSITYLEVNTSMKYTSRPTKSTKVATASLCCGIRRLAQSSTMSDAICHLFAQARY